MQSEHFLQPPACFTLKAFHFEPQEGFYRKKAEATLHMGAEWYLIKSGQSAFFFLICWEGMKWKCCKDHEGKQLNRSG